MPFSFASYLPILSRDIMFVSVSWKLAKPHGGKPTCSSLFVRVMHEFLSRTYRSSSCFVYLTYLNLVLFILQRTQKNTTWMVKFKNFCIFKATISEHVRNFFLIMIVIFDSCKPSFLWGYVWGYCSLTITTGIELRFSHRTLTFFFFIFSFYFLHRYGLIKPGNHWKHSRDMMAK